MRVTAFSASLKRAAASLAAAGLLVGPVAPSVLAQEAAPVISISGPFDGESQTLNGAGATFPAPFYSKWFEENLRATGVKVNYQVIGSGGGVKGIQDGTVDFAGSDAPMTDDQLAGVRSGTVFHIPAAMGAIVITYNIPGLQGQL